MHRPDRAARAADLRAIRFGSVLENVVCDGQTRVADYDDGSITENTRACYPIEFIDNSRVAVRRHPPQQHHLPGLRCLRRAPPGQPPVPSQVMYHFLSGYTAKTAGTEVGVMEPEATFSACFGAAFLVLHPVRYAELLAEKIRLTRSMPGSSTRAGRRALRDRLTDEAELHPRGHRRHPRRLAGRRPLHHRPDLRARGAHLLPERARRHALPARELGRNPGTTTTTWPGVWPASSTTTSNATSRFRHRRDPQRGAACLT